MVSVLALTGANLIWAGSPAASKAALVHVEPLTLGAARAGIAVAVFALLLGRRRERPATGRAPALLGLFGVALFCLFQNYGLLVADATTTALIGGGTPAAALGNLLPLASAVAFSLYAVLSRRAFGGGGSLAVIAGATGYGFLYLLPGAAIELAVTGVPALTTRDLLLLLFLGVGCSAVAFILCGYGFAHLEAGRAGAFANLKPLAGVALGMLLLGESLTLVAVTGGVLVLVGVGIASRSGAGQDLPCKSAGSSQVPTDDPRLQGTVSSRTPGGASAPTG
jgi:drug/metabolite transporter (DMT)-like permease